MILRDSTYWIGVAATAYLVSCWGFAFIRWFHTCSAPKEHRSYIWPDRKLQVIIVAMATVLLPYVLNPDNLRAWTLWKSYFPGTYFFYCGLLLFCFFGTVKQWNEWKVVSWVAAAVTFLAMAPLVLDAWIPGGMMKESGVRMWRWVVIVVGVCMMGYCGLALYQVRQWIREARNDNYSNPDDFPADYARRVWRMPFILMPMVWTGYLLDSPKVMAVFNVLMAVFNVVLLLNAMLPWRRIALVAEEETTEADEKDWHDDQAEERARKIAKEIEDFVKEQHGYLDPHLKIDRVVEHCSYSRTYVSHVFKTHFGGFSYYVNSLRLSHYDNYMKEHPGVTKDAAAQESGFSSYTAYYKVKERLERT